MGERSHPTGGGVWKRCGATQSTLFRAWCRAAAEWTTADFAGIFDQLHARLGASSASRNRHGGGKFGPGGGRPPTGTEPQLDRIGAIANAFAQLRPDRPPVQHPAGVVGVPGEYVSVIDRRLRDVEPFSALPVGRIGYDVAADVLLLHTVQSAEAYEVLRVTGTLVADPQLACPDFAEAYDWMYRQMAARLPTTGEAALWLWARVRRDALVSDCRRSRGRVLLTCRVPRVRVLLSHFLDWHLVLNRTLNVPRVAGGVGRRLLAAIRTRLGRVRRTARRCRGQRPSDR